MARAKTLLTLLRLSLVGEFDRSLDAGVPAGVSVSAASKADAGTRTPDPFITSDLGLEAGSSHLLSGTSLCVLPTCYQCSKLKGGPKVIVTRLGPPYRQGAPMLRLGHDTSRATPPC